MAEVKSYQAGKVILQDEPWVYTLSMEAAADHCYFCLKSLKTRSETTDTAVQPSMSTNRCSGCRHAKYCSVDCQKSDWQDTHKRICSALRPVIDIGNVLTVPKLLLLRLAAKFACAPESLDPLLQLTSPRLQNRMEFLRQEIDRDKTLFPMWQKFVECVQLKSDPKPNVTLEHYVAMWARGRYAAISIDSQDMGNIGQGIYLNASNIEHSCAPNACFTFVDRRVRLMALENIENIDQVRVSYLEVFHPMRVRQELIKFQLHIDCACVLCVDPTNDAERFCMPCVNKECEAKIPSDQRADLPCVKCGTQPKSDRQEKFRKVCDEAHRWMGPSFKSTPPVLDVAGLQRLEKKMQRAFHDSNPLWAPFNFKKAFTLRRHHQPGFAASMSKALEGYRAFLSPLDPQIGLCSFLSVNTDVVSDPAAFAKVEEASRVFNIMLGEDHQMAIGAQETYVILRERQQRLGVTDLTLTA